MTDASSYETLSREVAYDGYVTVHHDRVRMPTGEESPREYAENFDAVAVVPVRDDGRVVLLRQYRHPHATHVLEIPAGKLDEPGEDPAEAAQRELGEEVGYRAGDLVPLVTFLNSAGWTTETTRVYLGTRLMKASPDNFEATHEEAAMDVVTLPFDELLAMAHAGDLPDAKTLIGVLLAAPHVR